MGHKGPNLNNNNNYSLKYLEKSLSVSNTTPVKVTCINSFNYHNDPMNLLVLSSLVRGYEARQLTSILPCLLYWKISSSGCDEGCLLLCR